MPGTCPTACPGCRSAPSAARCISASTPAPPPSKLVVVDEKSQILYTNYQPNLGNPLPLIREQLLKIYKEHPGLQVASVTSNRLWRGAGEKRVPL